VQSFAWGSGDNEPQAEAQFEVRVIDGYQRFREYPEGKEEFQDLPLPSLNNVVGTGGEWSELPEMVGTKLALKIRQAADVVCQRAAGEGLPVSGDIEDGVCIFKSILDLGFFRSQQDPHRRLLRRSLDRRGYQHPSNVGALRTSRQVEKLPRCGHLRLAPAKG